MKTFLGLAASLAGLSVAFTPALSTPESSPVWVMQRTDNGVAFTMSPESGPEGVRLGVFCNGSKPSVVAIVDGESAPRLDLGLITEQGEASVQLAFQPKSKTYGGAVPAVFAELLSGKAGTALVSLNGAQYFHLGLNGASANVARALAACWTRPAQSALQPAGPPRGAVGALGIAPGHYVAASVPCAEAYEVFFYDGKRAGMVDPDGRYPMRALGKVTRQPGGSFYLDAHEIEVLRLNAGRISISIQDISPPMRICPAASLPKAMRVK